MKRFVLLSLLILPAMAAASWAAESPAGWVATPGDEWRAVDLSQTAVAPGSVLDMSRFIESPAGKYGRIVLDAQGHLVFEKNPSQRAIFFGCSISPEGLLGRTYTTHEEIRRWAGMVRQQGYNLVRPHFLDHYLTRNSSSDLEFDPEALDRFDYLVACLKEHGIYLYFDAMTSWRGFNKGNGWTQQAQATEFKSRIFVEDAVREHWKTGVRKLLQHVNPYTQTRLVDDPVVAVVLFFNEQNLNFYRSVNPHYTEPWRAWLKKKYGTTDALRRAWVDANGRGLLKEGVALENVPLFDSKNIWQADPRGRDLGLFVYEAHAELLEWYTKSIRELGYTGLVTHYDWLNHLGIQALRNRVPVISMHGYHAHPSEYTSPGSKVSQESSVAAGNRLFCSIATTRYNDRPLLITEYGQVFWNRYRYEEGLLMGRYAACRTSMA